MPIYEYQTKSPQKACEKCKSGFEYIQNIDEKPLSFCPYCGEPVKKIISWCHAAIVEQSPEYKNIQQKVEGYEKEGMYSHAAELADKYSHKTNDSLFKERALEDYKKAGYNLDASSGIIR